MTPDEFAPLGMNKDEAERAHAAIRRLSKECIDLTGERLRRGERPNLSVRMTRENGLSDGQHRTQKRRP